MSRRKKTTKESPFAKNLAATLKERRITFRDAAKLAGVSTSTISDWATVSSPSDLLAVKRLADALKISFAVLLTGEGEAGSTNALPSITEVFADGGALFDGYAKITIQRLVPRQKEKT